MEHALLFAVHEIVSPRSPICSVLHCGAALANGGGFATSPPPVSPPPVLSPPVSVSISPSSAADSIGRQHSVCGYGGQSFEYGCQLGRERRDGWRLGLGVISSSGLYTAPGDLPQPAIVTISATSHGDPSVSGTAAVTITSDVTVGLAPAQTSIELGRHEPFSATVAGSGHPDSRSIGV